MQAEKEVPVVTVDGPSGSGKGTLAQRLARHLGWHYLDSGAMYRILALVADKRGIALSDPEGLATLARQMQVRFALGAPKTSVQVLLEDQDISNAIRSEACGNAASKIAIFPQVRQALLVQQRAFRKPPGLVADGRDMGTVVFPHAMEKIFLTASAKERGWRRYKQLKEKGIDANLINLERAIAERDVRDEARSIAPLKPADDARVLDSTKLGVEEVFQQVLVWLSEKMRN
jgi:CMP/dCMP kinase